MTPRDRDFKRLVRSHARTADLPYTAARADLLGDAERPATAVAESPGPVPHAGVMRLSEEQPRKYLFATAAAYRCAVQSDLNYFAGAYVLDELGAWLPN